mgnify:CR=1 FL=1
MRIKNLKEIKGIFKKTKNPIFGGAVYAFERLGPEKFIENYNLLSLYNSAETALIKKDISLFCLEDKIKKRESPRNSTSLLLNKETQRYINEKSKDKKPLILVYKSSYKIEKLAKKKNWIIAIAPKKFGKKLLENKVNFRKILKKIKVAPPPGKIVSLNFLKNRRLSDLEREFGMPFVIQHPGKGGGKGTFFIKNSKVFSFAKKYLRKERPKEIIISKFIKGPSPSITGCVTRHGILSTRPQYQICDEPLLNIRPKRGGLFCGHDWSSGGNFSKNILKQAKEAVDRVGTYFKKIGYKGIFGLDFILDEQSEKLYVVECNPRLLASLPVLTMVQYENGEIPIIAFHLLEYLNIPYFIDIKKINSQMWQKKEGAQMFLYNPFKKRAKKKNDFNPGIYLSREKNLRFLRSAYELSHIKNTNEFLFTDGVPRKDDILKGYQRIRIITKKGVLDRDYKRVNKKTKEFLKITIKSFKKKFKKI